MRKSTKLQEVAKDLIAKIWYTRCYLRMKQEMENGELFIVDKLPEEVYKTEYVLKEIWKDALKSANKIEKKFGKKKLGPYDDFEWGMLNGKLSAIRWVLGDEWDMLDS